MALNKKQIKKNVSDMLSSGMLKSEVFSKLSGKGVKDSLLAYFVASHADPRLSQEHQRKVDIIVAFMFIQAGIGFLVGFGMGAKIGPNAGWIIGSLIALISLLLAWGFYKYAVGAFNVYILLSLIQLPRQFEGFTSGSIVNTIVVAIGVALFALVWYVRFKLFPDLLFMTPRKVKGKYVFSD